MIKVAINGFGRIGRAFFRLAKEHEELKIVAINDLGDIENIVYLLKYDTAYGKTDYDISIAPNGGLIVDGKETSVFSEKDPKNLPWAKLDIDVVVESTGVFTEYETAEAHIEAGAKRVVISAPAKSDPKNETQATVLMGINENLLNKCIITSNASCTTNASSPIISILDEAVGIEKAVLSTTHAYTSSQPIVDGPSKKDFRKGRAAAQNIIPSSTGAAKAVAKALPEFEGKFDGIALRVPVIAGSVADITFISKRDTSVDEINSILKNAATEPRWKGIFTVTEDDLVSTDIQGNTHAAIADLAFTRVVDGNLVKVLSWYDNEMGYAHSLVEHVVKMGNVIKK
jgi:glyceraldehyde 3-phosphate dehydrogenase